MGIRGKILRAFLPVALAGLSGLAPVQAKDFRMFAPGEIETRMAPRPQDACRGANKTLSYVTKDALITAIRIKLVAEDRHGLLRIAACRFFDSLSDREVQRHSKDRMRSVTRVFSLREDLDFDRQVATGEGELLVPSRAGRGLYRFTLEHVRNSWIWRAFWPEPGLELVGE